jgi:hypothetical protein
MHSRTTGTLTLVSAPVRAGGPSSRAGASCRENREMCDHHCVTVPDAQKATMTTSEQRPTSQARRTNQFAIAALVCGIVGIWLFPTGALIQVVLGLVFIEASCGGTGRWSCGPPGHWRRWP